MTTILGEVGEPSSALAPPSSTSSTTTSAEWDPAPIWAPAEERALLGAVRSRPADHSEGWTFSSFLAFALVRSPRVLLVRVLQAIAALAFVVMLRDLVSFSSWGQLWHVFRYPLWTLGLMLVATLWTRALPARQLLRYWLMGTMLVTSIVYYLAGPLAEVFTDSDQTVAIVPWLEELAKVAPVAVLLAVRRWSSTRVALSDLVVIGFVVGYGFRFTEDALWDRARAGGFQGFWGWLIPDAVALGGNQVVVGHATWTALAAVGLGLIVLHWRRPLLAGMGVVFFLAPIFDHMRANDFMRTEPWVHHLLFNLHIVPLLLVAAVVVAVLVDRHTLQRVREGDHLLGDVDLRPIPAAARQPGDPGAVATLVTKLRYLRLRNSAWYKVTDRVDPWPKQRSASDEAAMARLGRVGRRVGALDGTKPVDRGWAIDPVDPRRQRWFNQEGWTPYVVATGVDTTAADATIYLVEAPPDRPHARPQPPEELSATWWRDMAIVVGVLGGYAALRILTGTDPGPQSSFMFGMSPGGGSGSAGSNHWLTSLPDAGNDLPPAAPFGGPASGAPGPGGDGDPSDAPPDPNEQPPEDCP